jgi:hypothetical protein
MSQSVRNSTQVLDTASTGGHSCDLTLLVTECLNGFVVANFDTVFALVDLFLIFCAVITGVNKDYVLVSNLMLW